MMAHMRLLCVGIYLLYLCHFNVVLSFKIVLPNQDFEEEKANFIKEIIVSSPNRKGWINFLAVGDWPDTFFKKIQEIHRTFLVATDEYQGYDVEELLQYRVNTLVLKCIDLADFERKLNTARNIPFWHPHTNTIVYYQNPNESEDIIAKLCYILWYYKICNAILLQSNDTSKNFMVTHYNPYISDNFKLKRSYGCWTLQKITYPITSFDKSFVCTEGCHNVSLHSKLRSDHLGTCVGFETIHMPYTENVFQLGLSLFNDKTKNLRGFTFRTYIKQVLPFVRIKVNDDGTYTLLGRDGLMWNTLAETMNFTMDFSPSESVMLEPFSFKESIQQIYEFAQRKGDLLIIPVYQFDLVIVEIDMTVPFKASGVCFISHRAGFVTTLFDVKMLQANYSIVITFVFCFLGTWFVFFVFNAVEKQHVSFDQAGKDFVNAIRNVLSVSLYKPPKKQSFRLFLGISIWFFFAVNFATQAAIISFFSAHKRGKDVETYDDVIEKGYPIEGLASPDILLPDTEEKFRKLNSRLVSIQDIFGCINSIANDSHKFCLIDCSVGRYLERNKVNKKGEHYLHVAKDQIHSHYLIWIFHRDSPMTDEYNRIVHIFLQAGLIGKWEQYRFTDFKYEAPFKALDMDHLGGIFKLFLLLTGGAFVTFVIEILTWTSKRIKNTVKARILEWKRTRAARKQIGNERKKGTIKLASSYTQTI